MTGQTLTITGDLSLTNGSHVAAALGAVSGDAVVRRGRQPGAERTLDVSDAGGFQTGVYRLIDYSGALSGSGLTLGALPNGVNAGGCRGTDLRGGRGKLRRHASTTSFWNGGLAGDGSIAGGSGTWNANTIWTDASATSSGQIGASAFAVFQGTAGTVTVDTSAGPVTHRGGCSSSPAAMW